jgi:hypothetical protein
MTISEDFSSVNEVNDDGDEVSNGTEEKPMMID